MRPNCQNTGRLRCPWGNGVITDKDITFGILILPLAISPDFNQSGGGVGGTLSEPVSSVGACYALLYSTIQNFRRLYIIIKVHFYHVVYYCYHL